MNAARMSPENLKDAVMKQPSLLQYSVDSTLRPKLQFLLDEVSIDEREINRVITMSPAIMGLSLDQNLRPKVDLLKERCNLNQSTLGRLITTVPIILTLSLKRKIEPCLSFLASELHLSDDDLGDMIQSCPRILMQGIESSLLVKIRMIQSALVEEQQLDIADVEVEEIYSSDENLDVTVILKDNPSLLATTNSILRSRISKYRKSNTSLKEGLAPRSSGRKKSFEITKSDHEKSHQSVDNRGQSTIEEFHIKPLSLFQIGDSNQVSIVAFTSGCIYPKEYIDEVRGTRKSGGIAIQLPQINPSNGSHGAILEQAMKMSFGMIMAQDEGGSMPADGLVLAGFPFLRPSRNRCGLYACHGALKLTLQLLKQATSFGRDLSNVDICIEIITDSSYAWKLLKDTDHLYKWGSALDIEESAESMLADIEGPIYLANPDLLLPLARTVYRMTNGDVVTRRGEKLCIGKNVNIVFRHVSDLPHLQGSLYSRKVTSSAQKVAIWQFQRG